MRVRKFKLLFRRWAKLWRLKIYLLAVLFQFITFNSSAQVPTISSFSPTLGPIGTIVTITGTNFSTTPSNNIVFFGATQATVTASTSTQLTVTVPAGATYEPISISAGGLTGHAPRPFVVTFSGGGTIDDCSFAPSTTIATVPNFARSAFADVDGDGKPDLLIPNYVSSNFLSIFRNISTVGSITAGSFAPKIDFGTGTAPTSVAVEDLDGDGKRDIAVINYNGGTLSVYKNQSTPGTISLAAKIDFTIPNFADHVSIADMDGDGKQDLTITTSLVGLTVLRNTGTPGIIDASTFAAGVDFATGPNAFPLVLGDMDGDGKLDAAVPNANAYYVSLLRNTSSPGTISFATQTLTITSGSPAVGGGTRATVLGDIDGDNKVDLVVTTNTVNTVSLFRNTSTAGSISFEPKFDIALPIAFNTPRLSDLDGDGKIELIVDRTATEISVYKNLSSAGVINAASFAAPVVIPRSSSTILLAGDVDGDGRSEIISSTGSLQVFRNVIGTISSPTITSFSPVSGVVGASVTITGTNFSTPFSNTVEFNGIPATIIGATATSITTSVPVAATSGTISVQVGCNLATTGTNFTVVTSCVPAVQRAALVALYNSTAGASWTNNTNWLNGDEATWFGITLNGCDISNVKLPNNNLTGSLPTEIGDLTGLIELDLSFNHLNGSLPSSITNLTNLEFLKLDNNVTLSGPLPTNIGNMTALREIVTQGNAFTGPIPDDLVRCTALENIHLEGNQHDGVIPSFLGTDLINLYSINLGANQFTGQIPTELGNLSLLRYLNLASNLLDGPIPSSLGGLGNLELFDAHQNQLNGSIPTSFGSSMTSLYSLQLWSNKLEFPIPNELGNIISLQYVNLSDNLLSGSIPITLVGLPVLSFLELQNNQLTGTIPTMPTSIVFLRLSTNLLTGSIPTSLNNLSGLFLLDLNENQLTGSIPPELRFCTLLRYLNLNSNQLSGPLPPELSALTILEDLNLYDNQLSGSLPVEYRSFTNLVRFGISNNNFTGSVPIEYLDWIAIEELGLNNNQLDGIPTFTASTITALAVENNNLDFGDLEPNIGTTGYTYSPQAKLPPGGTLSANENSPISIPFSTSGSANSYQWFKDGSPISNGTAATFTKTSSVPADEGAYYVEVTSSIVTGLILQSDDYIVSVNSLPTILATLITLPIQGSTTIDLTPLITTDNSPLDINSLQVTVAPSSGALASIDANGILTLDYAGINFSGTETFSIQACDQLGSCATQQFEVEVFGEIEVFNALSPNGDNVNEKFIIQYINLIPDTQKNHVTIFNRWGDVVWEGSDYDNSSVVFEGTNTNGKELPPSTYFYKIDFGSGRESITGYLSLKR